MLRSSCRTEIVRALDREVEELAAEEKWINAENDARQLAVSSLPLPKCTRAKEQTPEHVND